MILEGREKKRLSLLVELVAALLAVPVRQTEITRLGVRLVGKRRSRVMSRQNRDFFFDSGRIKQQPDDGGKRQQRIGL